MANYFDCSLCGKHYNNKPIYVYIGYNFVIELCSDCTFSRKGKRLIKKLDKIDKLESRIESLDFKRQDLIEAVEDVLEG